MLNQGKRNQIGGADRIGVEWRHSDWEGLVQDRNGRWHLLMEQRTKVVEVAEKKLDDILFS